MSLLQRGADDAADLIDELCEALEAIDKTTFIGMTADSDETRHVALESAHDIANTVLAKARGQ